LIVTGTSNFCCTINESAIRMGFIAEALKCSSCGSIIDPDVTFRQCPKCLLDLGLWCEANMTAAAAPWEQDAEPALLDYEILERVGRGGMGFVFRARQRSLNRIVALKVVGGGDLASPAALARFRREAEAAAKLDHPNIVPIYEVGEHEANPFLVMRFIEGASLAERRDEVALAPGDPPRQSRITHLIATVARAVHYAHTRGVLHRDLKPSNILLDRDGNPHLTDFGIAMLIDQETALTQTAELLGTPCYMSSEQAEGKPPAAAADIYGLGVILYELLTGRRPFEAARPVEVLRKVIEEEPTAPQLINSAVDHDLATICLKCLDKNPTRRYRSALELAEDLERWWRHEPILARPAGPIRRLSRWTVRNPALATLIGGLFVGIAVTLGLLAEAREEKTRKSIALAILRTETARQLQEIWASPNPFFGIKSETLSAMAGKEPARLRPGEKRFTIAFVAPANPLDRILGAAPLLEHVEHSMSKSSGAATRLDLRLYKTEAGAIAGLVSGDVDFAQMDACAYLRSKMQGPDIQPLVRIVAGGSAPSSRVVIFTRADTAIKTLSDLRARSFLFGSADSTATLLAKAHLVEAGVRGTDLSKYRYLNRPEEITQGTAVVPSSEAPTLGNPFSAMTPVEAILDGLYDAGVAPESRFLQVCEVENLVMLERFEDPGALLVGRRSLPPEAARHFRQALINLHDLKVLHSFAAARVAFETFNDDDVAELHDKLAAESLFEHSAFADAPTKGQ
jgi:ABC-type phosphate/phosphonate transport system substrate-binding protein